MREVVFSGWMVEEGTPLDYMIPINIGITAHSSGATRTPISPPKLNQVI